MGGPNHTTDWHAKETYKGLIRLSLSGLRFAIFANGGAAVALLAFLGKEGTAALSLEGARTTMALFIAGVVLGGLAHVTAYLTQLKLYGESACNARETGVLQHRTFLWVTVLLVVASIGVFAAGAWCGVWAIQPVTR